MTINLVTKYQSTPLKGVITIPADKSIAHRSLIIGSLTGGKIKISNYSSSADCISTLNIIKNLGAEIEFLDEKTLLLDAKNCFMAPNTSLDCGNSGTSMRLLSGICAGQKFSSELIGDISLSRRPMARVIKPLELMGAKIFSNDNKAPLKFEPSNLCGIDYVSNIASAQVKSCILLAGLNAQGETSVVEPYLSRNHTELMLKFFNADIKCVDNKTVIRKSNLEPKNLDVVGDISSASFFIVATLLVPNSEIIIKNVGINQTRSGIIDVLFKMGANIEILDKKNVCMEDVADIKIKYTENLKPVTIEGSIIPRLIDELPIIAVLLTQANGTSIVKDASDLRNKESDRIKLVVTQLKKMGCDIEETNDGFIINGKSELKGECDFEIAHDHRLAMSLFVASLVTEKSSVINGFEWVNTSFPTFLNCMSDLGVNA
ncbi:MAG: 3-phosphoshikimate 1-carboxyvinyltransferase [Cyanobacteria bacterium SIG30]|nr:3-phosphoshikimate 1-carboxyvinyltransferase [Cyanobacteria bacterium SIG30]